MSFSKLDAQQVLREAWSDSKAALKVTSVSGSLVNVAFDYVAATYPTATQEVYDFKVGGSGGTTVATVTINYTDSTKANLLNASVS